MIFMQFAETSVRKVMFICTIKKVETLCAQNVITSCLHCYTVHLVQSYLHCILKTNVREVGLKNNFHMVASHIYLLKTFPCHNIMFPTGQNNKKPNDSIKKPKIFNYLFLLLIDCLKVV